MKEIHYAALQGIGQARRAISDAQAQFRPYERYLETARESAHRSALSLQWRLATPQERTELEKRLSDRYREEEPGGATRKTQKRRAQGRRKARPSGHWVVLETPTHRPEEPESTFEAFLDASCVHERRPQRRGKHGFFWPKEFELEVREVDREAQALLLNRLPATVEAEELVQEQEEAEEEFEADVQSPGAWFFLRPNTRALECQKRAVQELVSSPSSRSAPLVRLALTKAQWGRVQPAPLPEGAWAILKRDPDGGLRDGARSQREFVERALASPDFTLLEGPPGSGKTTAICELIVQAIRRGQRVLLVASTHVAVDNVLQRLIEWQDESSEKPVLPVRVGEERNVTSELVRPWTLTNLRRTWRDEVLDYLDKPELGSKEGESARAILKPALHDTKDTTLSALDRLLLESANLICGTTIGILQHPAIKSKARTDTMEPFDVLILDEASKTTWTEFLVPAKLARRWVVVGDTRQLSPYVEERDLTQNLRPLLSPEEAQWALSAFLASPEFSSQKRLRALVAVTPEQSELFARELEARRVQAVNLDAHPFENDACLGLLYADVVYGTPDTLLRWQHRLPGDLAVQIGQVLDLPAWQAHRKALGTQTVEIPEWADEVAWRLIRAYELRKNPEEKKRYDAQIESLVPIGSEHRKSLLRNIENVQRVAMPSILELLQTGAGSMEWGEETVLTDGFPLEVRKDRMVSLEFQHRMHPEISAFPREAYYAREGLLRDARQMQDLRQWKYSRYKHRAGWINIEPGKKSPRVRGNVNLAEAQTVLEELKAFAEWARHEERDCPWEVAVLTFYRGQEAELRRRLRDLTKQHGNTRNFRIGAKVEITLCTVDRFQGHEADLVLLSFVKSGSVGFLNSPNRLNVALTRARYQLVMIGHRNWMASEKCRSEAIRDLARTKHYPSTLAWE